MVRIQIYNGEPGEGGTVVIWGDQTNRYSVSTVESGYRVSESNPNNSDRQIQKISANTTGLELDAGTYWVEFSLDSSIRPFETIWAPPITINEEASTGNAIQFTGTTYQPLIDSGTQTPQGIPFHVYGTPNFPTPYCEVSDLYNVEPITRVLITEAGIDNSSSESSILKHEDFTNIVGTMQQGETYESAVEGFTDGPYINSIHIYIDWDQDGTFTGADEYFNGGTIHNSIGSEAEQAIGSIEVPVNALEGETRMRIIKTYDIVIPNPNNGCTGGSNYGQIEDYTINVIPNENMGISDLSSFDFAYYPNPVKDVLNITSQKAVESVSAFNLTGQKVMNNAKVNNGQIDVSNLVDGTYVFRVTLEDGQVETFKVIKK